MDFNKAFPILCEVLGERVRQIEEFGEQKFTPLEYLPILAEEFGEVSKEVVEIQYNQSSTLDYRKELIHLAAVVLAMIEQHDKMMGQHISMRYL